jgi:superfamily II DNA or RNA helicase
VGLRDRSWIRFIQGPDSALLTELYEPALQTALCYDRSCAYFSSSVLAAAARGFGPFMKSLFELGDDAPRPAIRLLVNEELSRDDVEALLGNHSDPRLADHLLARLGRPQDTLEHDRLALLGLLVQHGLLDVRVGLMRKGEGIFHAKYGIVTDADEDALVFSGSGNESRRGVAANYENLEISTSWEDPERLAVFRQQFESLWEDSHEAVTTLPLPEAVRLELIKFVPTDGWVPTPLSPEAREHRRHEVAMRWHFAMAAPYLPNGGPTCDALAFVDLWAHQVHVVEESAAAWPQGRLFCDEVGMGKTVEAILVLRRLLAGRGVKRALLLVPAGLQPQWQGELREKGGLLVPFLTGQRHLHWPDGSEEERPSLQDALEQPLLLASREFARLDENRTELLRATPWDLVLMDEAHAARRANQEEREVNAATLLLELLRQLQLTGQVRGLLLLSATPMQTHPWEPWDLLGVLGVGLPWLRGDFEVVRRFYHDLEQLRQAPLPLDEARWLARVVETDGRYPAAPGENRPLAQRLASALQDERERLAHWLRANTPLGRHMHRNTRATLTRYFEMGLLKAPPPQRLVQDAAFQYADFLENELYRAVTDYVDRRFQELERERKGKGFVMTVYRRRASSSPYALKQSLERRAHGLHRVIARAAIDAMANLTAEELEELQEFLQGDRLGPLSSALPDDPAEAEAELADVRQLLGRIDELGSRDSKFDEFLRCLNEASNDGRAILVFSEFTDTVSYLRDQLQLRYGSELACYTGAGGQIRVGEEWLSVSKDAITERLRNGEIRVMLCSDAASEGLNLQAAGALINYDLPWNPSRVEQRIGRIDRIGQRHSEVRVINMVLRDSIDERVYQVLQQRCNLFKRFVGAMQPVLAEARRMLLGLEPFNEELLAEAQARVQAEQTALAAFDEAQAAPPTTISPGMSRQDLARAFHDICPSSKIPTVKGPRVVVASGNELERNIEALPLSPLLAELQQVRSREELEAARLPLVIETWEDGAFRSAQAVWVGSQQDEMVESAERLEALLGMWDGAPVHEERRRSTALRTREKARQEVLVAVSRAEQVQRAGLESQAAAARHRLTRELGRFLLCLESQTADLNSIFHQQMQRGFPSAERLQAVHRKIGYPEWPVELAGELSADVNTLTANQRKNIRTGSPLDAALEDWRWQGVIS